MKEYTQEEIKEELLRISDMGHHEMCHKWRFAPISETPIYLRSDLPTGKAFRDRLFDHFGGFTPEISKKIGW